jgi:heme exporter protein D
MSGPYAFYIGAAYAVTTLVVAGLILWAIWDVRVQRRRLAALEARGARRLSETGAGRAAADAVLRAAR